jgi:hypothetical protein
MLLAVCVATLGLVGPAGTTSQTPVPISELEQGIRQVNEGDFEQAIETLDRVIHRLKGEKAQTKAIAQAYVYIGVAYLGLGHEKLAKARFLDAVGTDQSLLLGSEFSPKVLETFRLALDEMQRSGARGARPPLPGAEASERHGMLQIAIQPWAEVVVDGIAVGVTPFGKLPAYAGPHEVVINHPGFEPVTRRVTVGAGQVTKLVVDLSREGIRRSP